MLKSSYSNSAYGRMRDRIAEKEKQAKNTDKKSRRFLYAR